MNHKRNHKMKHKMKDFMSRNMFRTIFASGALLAALAGMLFAGCSKGVKEEFSATRAYRGLDALQEEVTVDPIDLGFPDPSGSGIEQELRQKASEAYMILNDARMAQGLGALRWDADLEITATIRANEIFAQFDPNHQRPDGTVWYTVNPSIMLGENIYKGKSDPKEVMESWMKNGPDAENFLCAECTKVAIAAYAGEDGTVTWAAVFGADVP